MNLGIIDMGLHEFKVCGLTLAGFAKKIILFSHIFEYISEPGCELEQIKIDSAAFRIYKKCIWMVIWNYCPQYCVFLFITINSLSDLLSDSRSIILKSILSGLSSGSF